MKRLVANAAVAGIAGGAAMIPFGLVLRRAFGYSLNVYGELLVRTILGRVPPWALAVEHLLVSWGMALPLVALLAWKRRGSPLLLGPLYGATLWLVVNSLLLPVAFGRPTPWRLGGSSIWPSLTVHVVYGAIAAVVARRIGRSGEPAPGS